MKSKKAKTNPYNFICLESHTGPLIVPYRVERSARLKRFVLQIDATRHVILKMPQRQPEWRGVAFLRQHGHWICESLSGQPKLLTLRGYLLRYPRLSLWGRWYPLELAFFKARSTYTIADRPRKVRIQIDSRMESAGQIIEQLRWIAREALPARVEYLSERFGVAVHGVRIGDQRGRWGSCSETGGISLNWRLILLPPRLQDHVILHELTHLKHFDHSKDFYACLSHWDPLAKRHAEQLDQQAAGIIHLGRD